MDINEKIDQFINEDEKMDKWTEKLLDAVDQKGYDLSNMNDKSDVFNLIGDLAQEINVPEKIRDEVVKKVMKDAGFL